MLRIYCPYCKEEREEVEFGYAGEAFIDRPLKPFELDDEQWAQYLFNRKNTKGNHFELWSHRAGCRKFFTAERNTATHQFINIWPFGDKEAKKAYTKANKK